MTALELSVLDYRALEGSVLVPLHYKINMIELSYEFEDSDIANYAVDATPYSCATDNPNLISGLQVTLTKLFLLI